MISMQAVRNPYLAHYYRSQQVHTGTMAPSIAALLETLNTDSGIALDQVRSLCFYGIPEECKGLRALLWRLLLGYLPVSPSLWASSLQTHRFNYSLFRQDLLSTSDSLLWECIAKDVHRTRPDLSFFFQPFNPAITVESIQSGAPFASNPVPRPFKSLFNYYYGDTEYEDQYMTLVLNNEQVEKHADVLARILYLYAKLNPAVQYVQGMNELLVPIYFAFAQDDHPEFRPYAEEDAFYCFGLLMAEVRDNFLRSLDLEPEGLMGKIAFFRSLLSRFAPELCTHLQCIQVEPHYYALKWITLLLAQDFDLPDTLRLWDSCLSDPQRFQFFYYVCVALVICNQDALSTADFAEALYTLQHPATFPLSTILDLAETLLKQDTVAAGIKP